MAVSYEEMQGSPMSENWTGGGFIGVRQFLVDWDDRMSFWEEHFGAQYPAVVTALARTASMAPFAAKNLGTGSLSAYDKAIVTVRYTTPGEDEGEEQEDGSFRAETFEPTAEFLTQPFEGFRWVTGNVQIKEDEAPGLLFRGMDYVIRLSNLDEVPDDTTELVNCVNDAPVTPSSDGLDGITFGTETLLYNPPTTERSEAPDGTVKWAITLRFTYKPNWDRSVTPNVEMGWNYFWRQDLVNAITDKAGKFDQMENTDNKVVRHFEPKSFDVFGG